MADEIDVGKLEIDLSGIVGANEKLIGSITDVKDQMRSLRKETNNLKDANEDQRKTYVELDADLKKLNTQYNANKKTLSEVEKGTNALSTALDKEVKSVGDAKKNNKELIAIRNTLNSKTEEGAAKISEINGKITENKKFIKENSSAWEGLGGALDQAIPGFGGAIEGIKGFTKSSLAFLATPIGAVIGLLAAGLLAVRAALTKSQAGMDLFNKISEQAGAILQALTGRVVKFGSGLVKLLSGNLDGLTEMGDAFRGIGEEIKDVVAEAGKLAELEVTTRRMGIATSRTVAILEKEAATYRGIEADATRSFAEREDAAKKAMDAELQRANELQKLAEQELKLIEIRNDRLRKQGQFTDEHWRAEVEARNKVTAAETEMISKELENATIRRQLVQDRLERDLDILIDGADRQKTINEQIIADDRFAIEERKKLLKETEKMMDDSLDEQVRTIQKFTKKRIDIDDLLKESDAKVLDQKIRSLGLSEIIEGRMLEVVNERRMAERDLTVAAMDLADEEQEERERIAEEALRREKRIADDRVTAQNVAESRKKILRENAHAQELQDIVDHGESLKEIELAQATARENFQIAEAQKEYDLKIAEIERSEEAAGIKAERLALAQVEMETAITDIQAQASEERAAIEEAEKQRRMAQAEQVVSGAQQLLGALSEINQAALDTRMDKLDKEKTAIEKKYDAEIAAAGENAELVAQLEQQKADAVALVDEKAAEAQKEFNKKQEKIQKAQAVFQVLSGIGVAFAQFGPIGAIVAAVAGIALLEAQGVPASGVSWLIRKFRKKRKKKKKGDNNASEDEFDGFAEGTSRVTGPGTRTSDSIPAWLSRDEAVIKASSNMDLYPGLSAAMNAGKVDQWVMSNFDNLGITRRLDGINRTISSKPNIFNIQVNQRDRAYLAREYEL